MTNRVEASQRRTDTRQWVMDRRERTRHLIELGGLVQKAGIIDLTHDDRSVIYGVLLWAADRLKGDDREKALALWAAKGKRAFRQERNGGAITVAQDLHDEA